MKPHPHEIKVEPRKSAWWNAYTKLAAVVTLFCAIVVSLGAWKAVLHWCDQLVRMPQTVASVQDDAKAYYENNDMFHARFMAEIERQGRRVDKTSDQVSNLLLQVKTMRKAIDTWTNVPPINWTNIPPADWSLQQYSSTTRGWTNYYQ